MNKKKLRIICNGGGSKGSFHVGVLNSIIKSDLFVIDKIYGASIGAIIAPLIANNKIDSLMNIYSKIKSKDDIFEKRTIFGFKVPNWNFLLFFYSFFKLGAYKSVKLIDQIFDNLNENELKIAQEKCHVVSYDLINNKDTWFTGTDLRKGIECSSALWLTISPIKYNNTLYIDSGVTEVFCSNYIIGDEKDFDGEYIFINCDSSKHFTNGIPTNALSLTTSLHHNSNYRLLNYELNKLKDCLKNKLTIINPDHNYLKNALDIDKNKMDILLNDGIFKGSHFCNEFI